MPRLPARFTRRRGRRALTRLFIGVIRRWWPMRSGGVLLETSLQRVYTRAELCQFVVEGVHIGLDCWWGVLPVLGRQGKRPGRTHRRCQRLHTLSRQRSVVSCVWASYSGERRSCPGKNPRRAGEGAANAGQPIGGEHTT